jgi:hypothetical protein
MKVKKIIENLQKLDPEQEILMAYWTNEDYEDLSEKDFANFADFVKWKYDWSWTHESMYDSWVDWKKLRESA